MPAGMEKADKSIACRKKIDEKVYRREQLWGEYGIRKKERELF